MFVEGLGEDGRAVGSVTASAGPDVGHACASHRCRAFVSLKLSKAGWMHLVARYADAARQMLRQAFCCTCLGLPRTGTAIDFKRGSVRKELT